MDLEHQLNLNLKLIQRQYADYVDCILTIVEEKGVSARRLSSYLLNLPASTDKKKLQLLSNLKAELHKAEEVTDIFILLSTKYASFLDYEIFETILKKYGAGKHREELSYPKYLKAYVEMHKIKEFMKCNPELINPKLQKIDDSSKKLNIKFSTKRTQNLSTLKEVTGAVAHILGLRPSALRLHGIKKGCIYVMLLISASIAEAIFTGDRVFSLDQVYQFRAVSVMWIECNGYMFDLQKHNQERRQHLESNSAG